MIRESAQVAATRRVGEYTVLTMTAPGIAPLARPGQAVTFAVGGAQSSLLARRGCAIFRAQERGVYGGTLEIVVDAGEPGTRWLAERRRNDLLDVIGPVGRGVALPRDPVSCLLIGAGWRSAGLFGLAEALHARGCRVDIILGAATAERLFGVLEARRESATLTVLTEDGSMGARGQATDALDEVMARGDTSVVYASGPTGLLRTVAERARERGAVSQLIVDVSLACGSGGCLGCAVWVTGQDGNPRWVRACVEGPTFRGDVLRWDRPHPAAVHTSLSRDGSAAP